MNNIEYIDSAELGTLIEAHLNAKSQGASLKLCTCAASFRKSCKSPGWRRYSRCATPKRARSLASLSKNSPKNAWLCEVEPDGKHWLKCRKKSMTLQSFSLNGPTSPNAN